MTFCIKSEAMETDHQSKPKATLSLNYRAGLEFPNRSHFPIRRRSLPTSALDSQDRRVNDPGDPNPASSDQLPLLVPGNGPEVHASRPDLDIRWSTSRRGQRPGTAHRLSSLPVSTKLLD